MQDKFATHKGKAQISFEGEPTLQFFFEVGRKEFIAPATALLRIIVSRIGVVEQ